MIPAYIIDKSRKDESEEPQGIQLEIPDYTLQYEEWIRKKEQEKSQEEPDTVIVIDIY